MNKTSAISLTVGVIILCVVVIVLAKYQAGQTESQSQTNSSTNTQSDQKPDQQLQIEDVTVGEGAEVKSGDTVSVDYTGTFTDGQVFDTSVGKQPFEFTVGQHQVIDGWDQGLIGMKVGGKRKLTVPPSLGYGASDYGNIPGGSTLLFEIELHQIK